MDFNPRSPHGERPSGVVDTSLSKIFQSTLPAWGATRLFNQLYCQPLISIHAPRMGSDLQQTTQKWKGKRFQSTLPAWGATMDALSEIASQIYFNPRSPHGERLLPYCQPLQNVGFQSTLPAWGATSDARFLKKILPIFQSTLPAWGATGCGVARGSCEQGFQSTLPAWGATSATKTASRSIRNFNPRSPHGERPKNGARELPKRNFNPRSPHGERRDVAYCCTCILRISIHAPRMGSDVVPATA